MRTLRLKEFRNLPEATQLAEGRARLYQGPCSRSSSCSASPGAPPALRWTGLDLIPAEPSVVRELV